MRKINLILDFDGVINNEPFATINAFKNVFRKIKCRHSPEEAFLFLKHLDENYGRLKYSTLIKRTFKEFTKINPDLCLNLFNESFKIKPQQRIISILDKYNDILNTIIFSRNNIKTIKRFIDNFSLSVYFNKIYASQKKYKLITFKNH